MPLLRIQTNVSVSAGSSEALLRKATNWVVTELNKPIDYVQVVFEPGACLAFAGTTEPAAFIELRALGLPQDKTSALATSLCRLVGDELKIAPARIFLNFLDVPPHLWGWNGDTFG